MIILYWVMGMGLLGSLSIIEAKDSKVTKECKVTDVLAHRNGYSHQYVFHSNCQLDPSQSETENSHEIKVFIPCKVDDTVKKNIEKMNEDACASYYSIKMHVKKDVGIECVINVNPDNLYPHAAPLELQKTTSITGKHGLVIKLHDAKQLNRMQAKSGEKRIIRHAYMDPKKRPTIVIDYGHGGNDTGFYDKASGVKEKEVNRVIGEKVALLLKKKITKSV